MPAAFRTTCAAALLAAGTAAAAPAIEVWRTATSLGFIEPALLRATAPGVAGIHFRLYEVLQSKAMPRMRVDEYTALCRVATAEPIALGRWTTETRHWTGRDFVAAQSRRFDPPADVPLDAAGAGAAAKAACEHVSDAAE